MPYKIIKEYKDFDICLKMTRKPFDFLKLVKPKRKKDLSIDFKYSIVAIPKTRKGDILIDKATGKYRRYD